MHDKEFGLIYNRARYYHPTLMRFMARDKEGYIDGMNLYQYQGSYPVGHVDPSGNAVPVVHGPTWFLVDYTGLYPGQRVPESQAGTLMLNSLSGPSPANTKKSIVIYPDSATKVIMDILARALPKAMWQVAKKRAPEVLDILELHGSLSKRIRRHRRPPHGLDVTPRSDPISDALREVIPDRLRKLIPALPGDTRPGPFGIARRRSPQEILEATISSFRLSKAARLLLNLAKTRNRQWNRQYGTVAVSFKDIIDKASLNLALGGRMNVYNEWKTKYGWIPSDAEEILVAKGLCKLARGNKPAVTEDEKIALTLAAVPILAIVINEAIDALSGGEHAKVDNSAADSKPKEPPPPPSTQDPRPPVRRVTNRKHHKNSKQPEPDNAQELYEQSVESTEKPDGTRWARDSEGVIHRFVKPSNGKTHWNGSTDARGGRKPISGNDIPPDIKRDFGYKPKNHRDKGKRK